MNEKSGWAAPGVAFGPDAALLVTFLATAVVQLLLTNPEATAEGLLPVPLATRAADSTSGLDFRRNNMVAAVGCALGDTEEATAKREERSLSLVRNAHTTVGMNGCNLWVCWGEKSLSTGI